MKMIVAVVLALVAVSHAAAVGGAPEEYIPIVRSEFVKQPEGSYNFVYETGNGIVRSEAGEVKQALDEENKPHDVIVVRGSYSYTDPEGKPETVNYFADETGYHAEGDSIPKPVSRR